MIATSTTSSPPTTTPPTTTTLTMPEVTIVTATQLASIATTSAPPIAVVSTPIPSATALPQVVSGPRITVKMVVVGNEAIAGFGYQLAIACANPSSVVFVSPANGLEGAAVTVSGSTVYPYNYTGVLAPGGIIGNWANLGAGSPTLYSRVVNAINSSAPTQPTPNITSGFTGNFSLKAGELKVFSLNEFSNLTSSTKCEVWATNSGRATYTSFSSTNGAAALLTGVNNSSGRWQSNLTAMNETITVTNTF